MTDRLLCGVLPRIVFDHIRSEAAQGNAKARAFLAWVEGYSAACDSAESRYAHLLAAAEAGDPEAMDQIAEVARIYLDTCAAPTLS